MLAGINHSTERIGGVSKKVGVLLACLLDLLERIVPPSIYPL